MTAIKITQKGDFKKTKKFLNFLTANQYMYAVLAKYGQRGVDALSSATPVKTGKTAASWRYDIKRNGGSYEITWSNTNVVDGVNVALILQTGHGTGTGGYVRGINYVNPALAPIFDEMVDAIWKEVTEA